MKTVTIDQFISFNPCYGEDRIRRIAGTKTEWTALDVLGLTRVPIADRLWAVLREDFLPAELLHEFACRCAERALGRLTDPDPRSVAAIEAKRAWLRGEIDDNQLDAAWAAARDAARVAARDAARVAAGDAARVAAGDAARVAAGAAARVAAWAAARDAARDAAWDAAGAAAWDAARDAERESQMQILHEMIEEATTP